MVQTPRSFGAVLLALAACGQSNPPAMQSPYAVPGATPGVVSPMPGVPGYAPLPSGVPGIPAVPGVPTLPALPAAPAPDCVVGRWDASDFLQMIRRNLRNAMSGQGELSRLSGTITLDFAPPDPSRQGQLVVTANDLVHHMALTTRGISVTGTVTLTGSATMPYRLVAADRLAIDAATQSNLESHAVVTTSLGVGGRGGGRERLNLTGQYGLQCTPAEARLWEVGADGQRRGQEIVLGRAVAVPR